MTREIEDADRLETGPITPDEDCEPEEPGQCPEACAHGRSQCLNRAGHYGAHDCDCGDGAEVGSR